MLSKKKSFLSSSIMLPQELFLTIKHLKTHKYLKTYIFLSKALNIFHIPNDILLWILIKNWYF